MSSPSKGKGRYAMESVTLLWSSVMETHAAGTSPQKSNLGVVGRLLGILPPLASQPAYRHCVDGKTREQ